MAKPGKKKATKKRTTPKKELSEVKKKYSFIVLNHNTKKFEMADNATEAGVHVERMASHQSDEQDELKEYLSKITVHQVSEVNRIDFDTDFSITPDITIQEEDDI